MSSDNKNIISTLNPAYFSMVMATGIVSIAANDMQMILFAKVLFWINIVCYLSLWAMTITRLISYFDKVIADLFDHNRCVGFFTMVAGTCVLASQFLEIYHFQDIALALGVLGAVLWVFFIYLIFTILTVKQKKPDLSHGIHGGWLVAVVATQSIAVVFSRLAYLWHGHDLVLFLSVAMWLGGGMLYIWMISLIFYRYTFFLFRADDMQPPYWINMGAVAISTLAGTLLINASSHAPFLKDMLPFLKGFTLVFWATGTGWIPMLVILGIWRHLYKRVPLRYDPLFWGAVFPLGMYTAATWRLADAIGLEFLHWIPKIFIWIAIAAWVITFIGLLHVLIKQLLLRVFNFEYNQL